MSKQNLGLWLAGVALRLAWESPIGNISASLAHNSASGVF